MDGRFQSRQFNSANDLSRLADFLVRARSFVGPCGFYHLGDLSWNVYLAELRGWLPELLRVWETPGGEVVGFAMYYPPNSVDIQSAPWLPLRAALEEEMLSWAREIRWREPEEKGGQRSLATEAFEQDDRFTSFLASRGFNREEDRKRHMIAELDGEIAPASLPEGYEIRSVDDGELDARGELQRSVWPWSRVGKESYGRLRLMPGCRRELDLVVVAPAGELVSFGICWYDEINRVGEFGPVGTHPEYRRRGLGKALLLEAMRRLRDLGGKSALVYPPGDEAPAVRLYLAAGFRSLQDQYVYRLNGPS